MGRSLGLTLTLCAVACVVLGLCIPCTADEPSLSRDNADTAPAAGVATVGVDADATVDQVDMEASEPVTSPNSASDVKVGVASTSSSQASVTTSEPTADTTSADDISPDNPRLSEDAAPPSSDSPVIAAAAATTATTSTAAAATINSATDGASAEAVGADEAQTQEARAPTDSDAANTAETSLLTLVTQELAEVDGLIDLYQRKTALLTQLREALLAGDDIPVSASLRQQLQRKAAATHQRQATYGQHDTCCVGVVCISCSCVGVVTQLLLSAFHSASVTTPRQAPRTQASDCFGGVEGGCCVM